MKLKFSTVEMWMRGRVFYFWTKEMAVRTPNTGFDGEGCRVGKFLNQD